MINWTVGSLIDNPQDAFMIFEEIAAWVWDDGPELRYESHPMAWWRGIFPTEEDVQRLYNLTPNVVRDFGYLVFGDFGEHVGWGYAWVVGQWGEYFFNQAGTVMELVTAFEPEWQAMIDGFFEQAVTGD